MDYNVVARREDLAFSKRSFGVFVALCRMSRIYPIKVKLYVYNLNSMF